MTLNSSQFQRGLSLAQFQARYATGRQCGQALVAQRWPQAFKCAHCGCKRWLTIRRFDLPAMLPRLLRIVATAAPMPLKVVCLSEACRKSGKGAACAGLACVDSSLIHSVQEKAQRSPTQIIRGAPGAWKVDCATG